MCHAWGWQQPHLFPYQPKLRLPLLGCPKVFAKPGAYGYGLQDEGYSKFNNYENSGFTDATHTS